MSDDIIFHQLSQHFTDKIYRSYKGKLRLAIILADLTNYLDAFNSNCLNILDIGSGGGQCALICAQRGHHVTLIEPVQKLRQEAQARFRQQYCAGQFISGTLTDIPSLITDKIILPQYDLILCHAVLEWLPEPLAHFKLLQTLIKPNGYLSLAFYNYDGLVLHNLIRGNLRAAQNIMSHRYQGGLTPTHPLKPAAVEIALQQNGWQLCHESGVRIFTDYMHKTTRDRLGEAVIFEYELQYRHSPEFRRIARYVHWLCQYQA